MLRFFAIARVDAPALRKDRKFFHGEPEYGESEGHNRECEA